MYLKNVFQIIFIIIILSSLCFQSCQKFQYSDEIRKVDSLLRKIEDAKNTLIVDEEGIKDRFDSINSVLNFIDSYYQGEMSLEDQFTLTNYRAVARAYRSYVQNFDHLVNENNAHNERISNLRKDLLAGRINKMKFKEIYENEKPVISSHHFKVKETIGSVVYVEPTYQRSKKRSLEIYNETLEMKQQAQKN